ncbi:DUF362 domain-containing protein [Lentisphaerota bacterium WC36G]|nr:DUF362 domain-containing protein [Lentisphaerae bacterium WC36]
MERRDFLKLSATASIFGSLAWDAVAETVTKKSSTPDLVAVRNGSIKSMFEAGLKEIGGLPVKGKKVLVKPNIGWNKKPELAANTNPELVALIVEAVLKAGAKEVVVFDHTCQQARACYKNSGIKEAVEKAGGKIIDGNDKRNYIEKTNKKAVTLKSAKFHKYVYECDYFINVPVLKNHGGATLTCAMKNLMGIVLDRRYFHRNGLHQCIADSVLYRKPDLNIVDAYRVMFRNGPAGRSVKDVQKMKFQLFSKDIVAVDVVAAKLLKLDMKKIEHIPKAVALGLGNDDLKKVKIKKISLKA